MQNLLLKQGNKEITITVAEQQSIIDRNEKYDSYGIERDVEEMVKNRFNSRTPVKFHVSGLNTDNIVFRGTFTADEDWWVNV